MLVHLIVNLEEVIPFIIIMMIFSHYLFIYIYTHFFGHMAFGILVPWAGIEPMTPALGGHSLNHWTTKEVQELTF